MTALPNPFLNPSSAPAPTAAASAAAAGGASIALPPDLPPTSAFDHGGPGDYRFDALFDPVRFFHDIKQAPLFLRNPASLQEAS